MKITLVVRANGCQECEGFTVMAACTTPETIQRAWDYYGNAETIEIMADDVPRLPDGDLRPFVVASRSGISIGHDEILHEKPWVATREGFDQKGPMWMRYGTAWWFRMLARDAEQAIEIAKRAHAEFKGTSPQPDQTVESAPDGRYSP